MRGKNGLEIHNLATRDLVPLHGFRTLQIKNAKHYRDLLDKEVNKEGGVQRVKRVVDKGGS